MQIGRLLARTEVDGGTHFIRVAAIILCIVGMVIALLFVAADGLGRDDIIALIPICGALLMVIAFLVYLIRHDAGRLLEIYEQGMVLKLHDQVRFIAWQEIDSITLEDTKRIIAAEYLPEIEIMQYHLAIYQGKNIFFMLSQDYAHYREIGAMILAKTQPLLLAQALEQVRQGAEVNLGSLALSRTGIRNKQKAVRWQDVDTFSLDPGRITLHYPNGKVDLIRYDSKKVRNFHILDELVTRVFYLQRQP